MKTTNNSMYQICLHGCDDVIYILSHLTDCTS